MWFQKALELIRSFDGQAGLLVKNLSNGEVFVYQEDLPFPCASIIKIPILLTLLDGCAAGKMNMDTVAAITADELTAGSGVLRLLSAGLALTYRDYATLMIVLSDNTAANKLIADLGMDRINAFCRGQGLIDTVLARKMMDAEARQQGRDNYTSCRDMLILFELIRSETRYETALSLLKEQQLNDLLPLRIAENFVFAHKTGGLRGIRCDVGIMYLDVPVFVAFFSKGASRDNDAVRLANEIGLIIFEEYKKRRK